MLIHGVAQLENLDFGRSDGLIPVVAQHARSGEILMLAYATHEALAQTLNDRVMWYFSRSRGRLWKKGETSGNVQRLVSLHADCDRDAVVARVLPTGPSCHTGDWSCFSAPPTLAALDAVLAQRAASVPARADAAAPLRADAAAPAHAEGAPLHAGAGEPASYTHRLLGDENLRLKKLGEEAVELALACGRRDAGQVAAEAADLLYHVLVACRAAGVPADDVIAALESRRAPGATGAPSATGALSAADVAPERRGTGSAG
jgi:phosphoribosyl-AMP cyclohydrolase / phosphoribosyl-ATP pyrophosphohydrolase